MSSLDFYSLIKHIIFFSSKKVLTFYSFYAYAPQIPQKYAFFAKNK